MPGGATVGNHVEETGLDAVLEQAHAHGFQPKVKDSMGQRFDRWLRRPEHVEDKAKYDTMPRNLKAQFRTAWPGPIFRVPGSAEASAKVRLIWTDRLERTSILTSS